MWIQVVILTIGVFVLQKHFQVAVVLYRSSALTMGRLKQDQQVFFSPVARSSRGASIQGQIPRWAGSRKASRSLVRR
jgi:hypothetical protein